MAIPQPTLSGLLGIGQDGRLGTWNEEAGMWTDFGLLGGKSLYMLGHDPQDDMYGVAQDGSFDFWNSKGHCWYNPQGGDDPNGWSVVQYLWGPDGSQWIVGTQGNVANGLPDQSFQDCGDFGGWTLKMLTFDSGGNMWGVGTAGNLGRWTGTEWFDATNVFGGWSYNFWAFDPGDNPWAIGTQGNVGFWNGSSLVDLGLIGGWQMRWLYWPIPGAIFGIG